MSQFKKNKAGVYPSHCANGKSTDSIDDILSTIRFISSKNIKEVRLRCFVNDVYAYLERKEGYHYGISEKAYNLAQSGEISSHTVTLDHGVPSKVINMAIKEKAFKTNEELLNFLRGNYYMCLITKDEDKLVNAEYQESMPAEWNNNVINWQIRYKMVGIELRGVPGIK